MEFHRLEPRVLARLPEHYRIIALLSEFAPVEDVVALGIFTFLRATIADDDSATIELHDGRVIGPIPQRPLREALSYVNRTRDERARRHSDLPAGLFWLMFMDERDGCLVPTTVENFERAVAAASLD